MEETLYYFMMGLFTPVIVAFVLALLFSFFITLKATFSIIKNFIKTIYLLVKLSILKSKTKKETTK